MGSYLLTKVNAGAPVEENLRLAEQAITVARAAVDAAPNDAMVHYAMAGVYQMRAFAMQQSGKDASMKEAIESFQRALAIDPRFTWALSELGDAFGIEADNEARHGRDPMKLRRNAIEQFDKAMSVDSKFALAAGRRLVNYRKLLEYEIERGREAPDAVRALLDGATGYEKMNPGPWLVAYWKVRAHILDAAYENAFGRSPVAALKIVDATILSFAGTSPDDYWFLLAFIESRAIEAAYLFRAGQDPAATIDDARRAIKKGIEIKQNVLPELIELRGRIELTALRAAKGNGKLDSRAFNVALELVQQAIEKSEMNPLMYSQYAEILALRVQWTIDEKIGRPDEDLATGLDSVEKALATNQRMAQALAVKGFLLLLKSHGARVAADRVELAQRAKVALEAALRENPLLAQEYGTEIKEIQGITQ
jgi:serine/threonine-protein kinase